MALLIVVGMLATLSLEPQPSPGNPRALEGATPRRDRVARASSRSRSAHSQTFSRAMRRSPSSVRGVVQARRRLFGDAMNTTFALELGFSRDDLPPSSKASALPLHCSADLPEALSPVRYSLGHEPVDRRAAASRRDLPFSWLAPSSAQRSGADLRDHGRKFHRAIGTVIFVAYLSALCGNPLHTATQYALLTALMAVGRTCFSSGSGYMAEATGWPLFFLHLRCCRDPEPRPAGLSATAWAFRELDSVKV